MEQHLVGCFVCCSVIEASRHMSLRRVFGEGMRNGSLSTISSIVTPLSLIPSLPLSPSLSFVDPHAGFDVGVRVGIHHIRRYLTPSAVHHSPCVSYGRKAYVQFKCKDALRMWRGHDVLR